jgi:NAD(P)-dependent dehydrogenase (short-subunit alcohol dehydrogenase family)
MTGRVDGKVVVVTGAARGMGRAYVRGFLEHGARVVATDQSWAPSGVSGDEELFRAELADRADVLAEVMDITIDSHVKRVYEATMDRFGTVDVIINNAGLRQRDLYPPHGAAAVLETTDEDWRRMLDTNVIGVLRVIRAFAQPMLQKRRGSIINIASGGSVGVKVAEGVWTARNPGFRNEPYDASKAALTNMSFFLAEELREYNVAVNVVFPSATRTTGSDEIVAGRAALGMRVGALLRPEHVVPLVLHLAEQDASGETGQAFDAVRWNIAHGFGGPDQWLAQPIREGAT